MYSVTRDEGGIKKLFRVDWNSKVESIPLPFEGSIGGMNANSSAPGLLVRMQGWTQSQKRFTAISRTSMSSSTPRSHRNQPYHLMTLYQEISRLPPPTAL